MKKRFIKALCICLALTVLLATTAFAAGAADGEFSVLQITDTSDMTFPLLTILKLLITVHPDQVILPDDFAWLASIANTVLPWVNRFLPDYDFCRVA
ncbi:MAG: hypothetical protein LBS96_00515 [Oscillospiraceae bacterium]|jgi:hypothetical protein|nr:hypothetical protein [Oscillospiraceae bacterium]